jgi:aryl-alcohol dehydrogenase-like predicted oxidoreductase
MTYEYQNTVEEAAKQLDFAIARGVNFIDTAEMYPVPGKPETQGKTEEYIDDIGSKQHTVSI